MRRLSFIISVASIGALLLFLWAIGSGLSAAEVGRSISVAFDDMEIGIAPTGFSLGLTGEGGPVTWFVQAHDMEAGMSNVVVQTSSEQTSYRFPLCIYDDFMTKDGELSVRFKPLSGQIDQAAGLVWRYQDPNNYYVVRANALENNVVLYKMEDGNRNDLKPEGAWFFSYGAKASVPGNQWSTLRVIVTGDRFAVWLNDEHLFDVEDDTFQAAGKVGLWTKADSVTAFDDLTMTSYEPE